jgi:hypothetical protein
VADRFIKDVKEITAAIIKVCMPSKDHDRREKYLNIKTNMTNPFKSSCVASVSHVNFIEIFFAFAYMDVVIWTSQGSFWHTQLVYNQF